MRGTADQIAALARGGTYGDGKDEGRPGKLANAVF